jgi:hypothetical protein
MAGDLSWLDEFLRGVAGTLALGLLMVAARRRWKRGERHGEVGDIGLD